MMEILGMYAHKQPDSEGVVNMSQNPSREPGQFMQVIDSNLTLTESISTSSGSIYVILLQKVKVKV